LDWQRVLLAKVLSSISVMRGYEALHASGVESPWGIVAIAAATGTGKTTLALELMSRGWPLVSDDVLALAGTPDGVLAFPGTPHMNVSASASDPTADCLGPTLAVLAGERWVATRDAVSDPRRVHVICMLARRRGLALDVQFLPRNPLALAPFMLGLTGDAERERSKFELYADLMGGAELMRLTCGLGTSAAQVADLLEQACVEGADTLAVGGAW